MKKKIFKSGFISLIGHPNVGKSTLLNTLLGEKVAIVSSKAQTTRNVIRGIYTDSRKQIVFLDTPGIHRAQNKLGNYMNSTARSSYHNVEGCLVVIDCKNETIEEYKSLIEDILKTKCPLIIVLNKIDLLEKKELQNQLAFWNAAFPDIDIVPISALDNDNCDHLLDVIETFLPEGPQYYPEEMVTDNPESFLMGEIVREKILKFTKEEVPHSVAVVVDKLKQTKDALEICCTIIVERDSQKGIIIGKQGSMIKRIGTSARQEIENIFQTKVRLETFVRVEKDWRNSSSYLKEFGYNNKE